MSAPETRPRRLGETGYAPPNAWEQARRRLALLEACHDPASIRRAEALGVGGDWHCLDAGAGRRLVRPLARPAGRRHRQRGRRGPRRAPAGACNDARPGGPPAGPRRRRAAPGRLRPSSTPAWCSSTSPSASGCSGASPPPCAPAASCWSRRTTSSPSRRRRTPPTGRPGGRSWDGWRPPGSTARGPGGCRSGSRRAAWTGGRIAAARVPTPCQCPANPGGVHVPHHGNPSQSISGA